VSWYIYVRAPHPDTTCILVLITIIMAIMPVRWHSQLWNGGSYISVCASPCLWHL